MDTETNDNILSEYMMILEFISLDQCSFAERQDILDVAGRAVSRIHPPFRELAERQLQEIMKPKKKLPPCE
jgi:hypothetical protein